MRNEQQYEDVFGDREMIQPLLSADAATDSEELSFWQRWLISSPEWQNLVSPATELIAAEILELLGTALRRQHKAANADMDEEHASNKEMDDDSDADAGRGDEQFDEPCEQIEYELEVSYIAFMHSVIEADDELLALWRTIGMPAECPAGIDVDLPTAYKQQFEQQMRAAVAKSAPWMFDSQQQLEKRVADWMQGRLPSGDAVFFRRYHIRPLWHTGVDVADFNTVQLEHLPLGTDDERREFPVQVGIDLVDAAGVSYRVVVKCSVGKHDVTVNAKHEGGPLVSGHATHPNFDPTDTDEHMCDRIDLHLAPLFDAPPSLLAQYVCHGHLHGLSEQQWSGAMGWADGYELTITVALTQRALSSRRMTSRWRGRRTACSLHGWTTWWTRCSTAGCSEQRYDAWSPSPLASLSSTRVRMLLCSLASSLRRCGVSSRWRCNRDWRRS